MSSEPDLKERDLGEAGLTEALTRLKDRLNDSRVGDPLISLAETLGWCYSLENYLRKLFGDRAYFSTRDASGEGQATAGLMYARGLITHSLAEVAHLVTLGPARTFRMGGTRRRRGHVFHRRGAPTGYVWKSLSELPLPDKPEKHGRDTWYRQHVERREVLQPLEAAVVFLSAMATATGPR